MFNLIFAIDKSGLVGNSSAKYGMPWHYPEDLKFYKKMTTGKKCIVGRTTFEAMGGALPNRETYVLTRNDDYVAKGAKVITSLADIDLTQEWFICGGPNVFKQFWDKAQTIYITRIDKIYDGDVYFNDFSLSEFKLETSKQGEDKELIFEKWVRNEN